MNLTAQLSAALTEAEAALADYKNEHADWCALRARLRAAANRLEAAGGRLEAVALLRVFALVTGDRARDAAADEQLVELRCV